MRMQVYVETNFTVIDLLLYGSFDCPNSRLLLLARIDIVTVQVLTESIKPIVPPVDPVRVQHGNDFEDEALSEDPPLLTLLIRQELPDAVEHK